MHNAKLGNQLKEMEPAWFKNWVVGKTVRKAIFWIRPFSHHKCMKTYNIVIQYAMSECHRYSKLFVVRIDLSYLYYLLMKNIWWYHYYYYYMSAVTSQRVILEHINTPVKQTLQSLLYLYNCAKETWTNMK